MNEDFMAELAAEAEAEQEAPPEDALEFVQKLGAEVNKIDARLEKYEEVAAEMSARRNEILGKILPDFMDQKRLEKFTVDGRGFSVDNYFKANIPKENPEPGLSWLEENGHGDILKNTIVVTLPKDSEEMAKEIETYVRQRYQEAVVERNRSVPWASLTAWLKELWNSADPEKKLPPLDIIGGTVGRIVKIKEPKKNK